MRLFTIKSWFYVPISLLGAIITLIALDTDVWFFMAIDRHSHSASDTLTNFLPYFISVWVIFTFIASNTSFNNKLKNDLNDKFKNNQSGQLRIKSGNDSYGSTLFLLVGCCLSCIF